MAGFASIIDALGGLTVDVGPEPLPVGGITPTGRHVKPDRYIPAGTQHLDGTDTLAVARSRTNSDDYTRMGRQRCLLQYVLQQKSPANLLANFQDVAAATTDSVSTNIPQQVLPALVKVADSAGTRGAGERVVRPEPGRPERAGRPVRHLAPGRRVHEEGRARHHRRTAGDGRSPGRPDQRPVEPPPSASAQSRGDGGRGRRRRRAARSRRRAPPRWRNRAESGVIRPRDTPDRGPSARRRTESVRLCEEDDLR